MPKTWLVLDVPYLCWRIHRTPGLTDLSSGGVGTGVVFGFLRDWRYLQSIHNTLNTIFAFDSPTSKRAEVYPAYKELRKGKTPEEEKVSSDIHRQIDLLRMDYLPSLGCKNIFLAEGYEADDVIGSVVLGRGKGEKMVMISSDEDLYQLLAPEVSQWNPRRKALITHLSFAQEYHIHPAMWIQVKAIAGCHTDGVAGVAKGIGEKTACKYVNHTLPRDHKAWQAIRRGGEIIKRNLRLVTLPYPGTPEFSLQEDVIDKQAWKTLLQRLEIKSLGDW